MCVLKFLSRIQEVLLQWWASSSELVIEIFGSLLLQRSELLVKIQDFVVVNIDRGL